MDFGDPELAKEMIKLLGQELKLLRAQLSDANQRPRGDSERSNSIAPHIERTHLAEAENARLKAQIIDLESRVVQPQHATGDNKHVVQLETALEKMKDQLAELSEEKDRVEAEKDAKISRLQDKYKLNREKYKVQKSTNANIQQEYRDVEAKFEELRRNREVEHDQILSVGFNFQNFLSSAPNREYPNGIQPHTKELQISFSEDIWRMLYKAAPETLHYNDQELLWSGDNISRAVAILPLYRYNPKARRGKGTWERASKPFQGKKCNLFYRFQDAWSYMGTFQCVQATPLESDQLSAVPPYVKQYVHQRTILFRDLVPKVLSDMVKGMYDEGVLRAECFALEFQSFDENLNEQLLGSRVASSQYQAQRLRHRPNPDDQFKRSLDSDSGTSPKKSSKKRKTL